MPPRIVRAGRTPYGDAVTARSASRRDRQVIRLLGIVRALTNCERLTLAELRRRFGASRETIYRDVRAIQTIGYPIEGDERGHLFPLRLSLSARETTPPIPLTRQEVAAVVWAARQTRQNQPFAPALSTALPKLQALAGRHEARFAAALDGSIGGWERGTQDYSSKVPLILRLVEAIVSRRRCRLTHQVPGHDEPSTFLFDPYRLVMVQDTLYCLGWGHRQRRVISPAVGRMREVESTDEVFTVHPTFDAKRWEAEAFGIVWERPTTVVLRFRADQAPYVRERQWHPSQRIRELRGGRVELTLRVGGTHELVRWVLGWGDAVEVSGPIALKREVEAIWRRVRPGRRK